MEKDVNLIPTNAFALLSGHSNLAIRIQCGVFKGKTRSVFIDRREFSGPIQNQVKIAYEYVLSKINLGAKINGLFRQDEYELPANSIREIIANAMTHRSYLDPGNVQIALFDDRLEVTSPGMLLNGVTIEKMKEGYSKVRNRAIAPAFVYMKIIEEWGSGIPRIIDECRERDLPEPELIDFDGDFRVNLYRSSIYSNIATNQANQGTNQASQATNQANQTLVQSLEKKEIQYRIINVILQNQKITQANIAKQLDIPMSTIKYHVKELRERGILTRQGTSQTGIWIVKL